MIYGILALFQTRFEEAVSEQKQMELRRFLRGFTEIFGMFQGEFQGDFR